MRLVIAEGSPSELAQFARESDLAIQSTITIESDGPAQSPASHSELEPPWLEDFLTTRAGKGSTESALARLFVRKVLELGTVDVKRGKSTRSGDGFGAYVQVRKLGKQHVGALAYMSPSSRRCDFRLRRDAVEGYDYAEVINPRSERLYNVRVYLTSEDAVDEAVELVKKALDVATS